MGPSHQVIEPADHSLPLVFASPHSGSAYPAHFLAASKLDPQSLRRSEDSFVDEIFGAAPHEGAPLIRALFPRAFVDPNREPFELDPGMFSDPLPSYINSSSPRVAAGLGTIARIVANGTEIYRDKLSFAEAMSRIRNYYWPYHDSLRELVERTRDKFGFCILIDCHSMPSVETSHVLGGGRRASDIVLGDCHGRSCAAGVTRMAERSLRRMGYPVARNIPYSGGFVTRHYGRPAEKIHGLQIEINRCIYMDEQQFQRKPVLERLAQDMRGLIRDLGSLQLSDLRH
ncbi:MAG: N-formylglutamate amidohydrolase [Pseudomonadota bacterium]